MRPKKHEATWEGDLFRARLDQIINMKHELVQLGGKIDWAWIGAPDPLRPDACPFTPARPQSGFLTGDYLQLNLTKAMLGRRGRGST
jgi:hypothetical protein